MHTGEIQKIVDTGVTYTEWYVEIDFPKTNSMYGLFIKNKNYGDPRAKNF